MKIAVVTQYFWPETFSINEIVKVLEEQGHEVTVFTGKPNYPEGKIFEGYVQDELMVETFGKSITINRVPLTPRGSGGAKGLLKNYLSFVWNGWRYFPKMVDDRQFDVILACSFSPITSVLPAIWLKRRLRKHLAVWVFDLWPESLSATGYVRNPMILRLVKWLVKYIYRCSDTILVQSRSFVDAVGKYADKSKIIYYPNSYLELPNQVLSQEQVSQELVSVLENHFSVVFAGNLGKAQALPTLLDAAEKLRDLPSFKLVLIGSGSMSDWLQDQIKRRSLLNVFLAGRYPAECMPAYFSKASCLLVSLGKDDILAKTVPAKVQAYLASGRPILASMDGEAAQVIEESGVGFASPAEDVDKLVENIRSMYALSPEQRMSMGENGRNYFMKHYEMRRQVSILVDLLTEQLSS